MRGRPAQLLGQRFDKLLVVARAASRKNGARWVCRCDCGNEVEKLTSQLTRAFKHTGCRECESISRSQSSSLRTHGECTLGKTNLYMVWKGMHSRCRDKGNTSWKYYGSKGIKVCDEWAEYPVFKQWAEANGYVAGLTIDRLCSDSDYSPTNCEWVTAAENTRRMLAARRMVA